MKRGSKILKAVLRIYSLHLGAILAIWLGMYFPGVDLVLAAVYLGLIWAEGSYAWLQLGSRGQQALVAFLWQLPGFFMGFTILTGLDRLSDMAYYFVFILELWQTPVLPWLSLLPVWTIQGTPLYYSLLFVLVPVLTLIYLAPAWLKARK